MNEMIQNDSLPLHGLARGGYQFGTLPLQRQFQLRICRSVSHQLLADFVAQVGLADRSRRSGIFRPSRNYGFAPGHCGTDVGTPDATN